MSTDTTTAETFTLGYFDPAELAIDINVRTDAEATVDAAFVASIKATKGNLVPVLLLRTAGGRLRVDDGARRTIACQRAKVQVQGIIIGDEGDDQAARRTRIIRQVLINDDRLGLTVPDRAAAMLTLFDAENMTAAGIAKATGRAKAEVEAALAVARSETATKAAARWEFLTLPQAATLAEFEGDTEALTALAKAAKDDPAQFDHVAQQYRDSAADRAQRAGLVAELEAAGYQVADSYQAPHRLGWSTVANYYLDDAGKEGITHENHAACPHRAVRIVTDTVWPPEAEAAYRAAHDLGPDDDVEFTGDEEAADAGYVDRWVVGDDFCADPDAAGHVYRYSRGGYDSGSPKPEPGSAAAEKEKEARRHILGGNKLWRSATVTRLGHVKTLVSRKDLKPKALETSALLLIAEAVARHETQPDGVASGHDLACELLGLPASGRDAVVAALAAAAPARRVVIMLAMVLAAAEGKDKAWGSCANMQTWQQAETGGRYYSSDSKAGRYLAWLEANTGYALTDLEVIVARGKPADVTAPAGDGADGTGADSDDEGESPADSDQAVTGDLSAVIAAAPGGVDTGHGIAGPFDAFDVISGNATDAELAAAAGRCRGCGCTDAEACPGGCTWVEPGLCSTCAGPPAGPVVTGEAGEVYEVDSADLAGPDDDYEEGERAGDGRSELDEGPDWDEADAAAAVDDAGYAGDDAESSR
jgi:ParB family chromosome partitioning protein